MQENRKNITIILIKHVSILRTAAMSSNSRASSIRITTTVGCRDGRGRRRSLAAIKSDMRVSKPKPEADFIGN